MAMKDRFDTSVASLFWEGDWCHLSTHLEEDKMVMILNTQIFFLIGTYKNVQGVPTILAKFLGSHQSSVVTIK